MASKMKIKKLILTCLSVVTLEMTEFIGKNLFTGGIQRACILLHASNYMVLLYSNIFT